MIYLSSNAFNKADEIRMTEHSSSDTLTVNNVVGRHKIVGAGTINLQLPVITDKLLDKEVTMLKWSDAVCAFLPGAGNTIADGADDTIVIRNSQATQAKVAKVTLRAVSLTEWALGSTVGSWVTEPA